MNELYSPVSSRRCTRYRISYIHHEGTPEKGCCGAVDDRTDTLWKAASSNPERILEVAGGRLSGCLFHSWFRRCDLCGLPSEASLSGSIRQIDFLKLFENAGSNPMTWLKLAGHSILKKPCNVFSSTFITPRISSSQSLKSLKPNSRS